MSYQVGSVTSDGALAELQTFHSLVKVDQRVWDLMRAGKTAAVEYKGHRVGTFPPEGITTLGLPNQPETDVLALVQAAVLSLADTPAVRRPRALGSRQREIKRVIEEACLGLLTPQEVYQQLRPYFNNVSPESLW